MTGDHGKSNGAELHAESGELSWRELLPHFARGVVVRVGPGLDLIEVAQAFRDDDTPRVSAWLQRGALALAADADARRWNRNPPVFQAIVVAPWVLAREIAPTH
jgi:hypothetical protein